MRLNLYNLILDDGRVALTKERGLNWDGADRIITPHSVYEMMHEVFQMGKVCNEYVYAIVLNTRGVCRGILCISKGGYNMANVDVRTIFSFALLTAADRILLCHNHPSEDVSPSGADIIFTKRIHQVASLLGMELADHIIVGKEGYYSFAENNALETQKEAQ